MKPYRCRVCLYVGCVNAEPFQKMQTLLIYKAYMEILDTEGRGVTSEVKGKLLWGTSPAPGRRPTLGTEAPLQAWDGQGTREDQASPSVHVVFAHTQQSVPAVPQNRNLSPSDCQKGIFLRPRFVFSVVLFILFFPQLPIELTQCWSCPDQHASCTSSPLASPEQEGGFMFN